jgi:hypothetical protein
MIAPCSPKSAICCSYIVDDAVVQEFQVSCTLVDRVHGSFERPTNYCRRSCGGRAMFSRNHYLCLNLQLLPAAAPQFTLLCVMSGVYGFKVCYVISGSSLWSAVCCIRTLNALVEGRRSQDSANSLLRKIVGVCVLSYLKCSAFTTHQSR